MENELPPRVLSDEEIEMYLKGDRREVDRLILFSLNRLAACIIPHASKEEKRDAEYDRMLKNLGGAEVMLKRAAYVDALLKQAEDRAKLNRKILGSSVTWVIPIILAFLAASAWDSIVLAVKTRLGP